MKKNIKFVFFIFNKNTLRFLSKSCFSSSSVCHPLSIFFSFPLTSTYHQIFFLNVLTLPSFQALFSLLSLLLITPHSFSLTHPLNLLLPPSLLLSFFLSPTLSPCSLCYLSLHPPLPIMSFHPPHSLALSSFFSLFICLSLSQHAEQQQHQQYSSLQFQPHAKAPHIVSLSHQCVNQNATLFTLKTEQ